MSILITKCKKIFTFLQTTILYALITFQQTVILYALIKFQQTIVCAYVSELLLIIFKSARSPMVLPVKGFKSASSILHCSYSIQNYALCLRQRDSNQTAHSWRGLLSTLDKIYNLCRPGKFGPDCFKQKQPFCYPRL